MFMSCSWAFDRLTFRILQEELHFILLSLTSLMLQWFLRTVQAHWMLQGFSIFSTLLFLVIFFINFYLFNITKRQNQTLTPTSQLIIIFTVTLATTSLPAYVSSPIETSVFSLSSYDASEIFQIFSFFCWCHASQSVSFSFLSATPSELILGD